MKKNRHHPLPALQHRNPQLRRMLAKLGHKVRELTRIRMGSLNLHGLAPGQVRSLTPREVRELKELPKERKPVRRDPDELDEAPVAAVPSDADVPDPSDDEDWES